MNKPPRTSVACEAVRELIDMKINRQKIGRRKLLFVLGWCAMNGMISEPEANILVGRAGELTKYSKQGYFRKYDLPPGLKASHHFPHMHYFHMTEKGGMLLAMHDQELAQYGNIDLYQRTYLHDHIGRIEAAWRLRVGEIIAYIPEIRLTGQSAAGLKQPDGIFILPDGQRVGIEVEAADWKSGSKLAQFITNCLNSLTSGRVQQIIIFVQTRAAKEHYAAAFKEGQAYHKEWLKENGKWWPIQKTKTLISKSLSTKVKVELIASKEKVDQFIAPQPIEWMPSVLMMLDDYTD